MYFERITTPGLSHHSYFVSDGTEAVVIDARRDVDVYVERARELGVSITHILETHRQEDFVLGSTELAARVGAEILHGQALPFEYGRGVEDGEEIAVGGLRLRALETPGHTAESLTWALADTASGEDTVIAFTGDALFVGETGRTDLYGSRRQEQMAGLLYDSLFQRIFTLGDGVILAPAHGGGSVCGKGILPRNESTLGYERIHNRLLSKPRHEFVRTKTRERMVVPPYFSRMEAWNLQGPPLLGFLPLPASLSPQEFSERYGGDAVVVDVRSAESFAAGHVPGSYSLWLAGLSVYAGWVLPYDTPILLVADSPAQYCEAVCALVRVGFERIEGALQGGFEAWQSAGFRVDGFPMIRPDEAERLRSSGAVMVDVRNAEEWGGGVIPGTMFADVAELEIRLGEIPADREVITFCSVGHRGSIAASMLRQAGYERVYNLGGGFKAWQAQEFETARGLDAEAIAGQAPITLHEAVGDEVETAIRYVEEESQAR